ncbi:hypothetical protein A9Q99_05305 [Gammaproteobacteria bacterium 45_16_T64]|nr:hypothetical protein A9Q99_05305 [Gammaproteobacteria bacterium 45_16_T64]
MRLFFPPLLYIFSLSTLVFFGAFSLSAHAELAPPQLQEQVGTIKDYYQTVRDKAANNTTSKPIKRVESKFGSSAIPTRAATQPQNPIRAGDNYRAAAYTLAGRDPFSVTPIMLENENYTLKKDVEFTPLAGDFKIPNMYLKGIITGKEEDKNKGKMAALLEIEGLGVFVVREGDTVGLHGIGNGRDVIQIESISRLSLIVRSGSFGGTAQKRIVVQ